MTELRVRGVTDMGRGRSRVEFERPFVNAHDAPAAALKIKASLEAARERVRAGSREVACPAGCVLGVGAEEGLTIRCGVERSLITEQHDPSSLVSFCLTDGGTNVKEGYQACPSWRAEKERVWQGRLTPLVSSAEGV